MSVVSRLCKVRDSFINDLYFQRYKPIFEEKPDIRGSIHMFSDRGAISFGKGVRINSSLRSNPVRGKEGTVLYAFPGGKITFGNNCGISNSTFVSRESITIEDDVFIGGDCKIYDSDFHSLNYAERISGHDTNMLSKPVVIKKGAFIGADSIILKGVVIGEKSIIGAGSVVTKNVPDGEIWAGNPARFLKKIEDIEP